MAEKRTLGIKILAIAAFFLSVYIIEALLALSFAVLGALIENPDFLRAAAPVVLLIQIGALAVSGWISVGFWKLRNCARRVWIGFFAAVFLGCAGVLVFSVISFNLIILAAALVGMAFSGSIVGYLFQPSVRAAFGLQQES